MASGPGEDSGSFTEPQVTQRAFLTSARLQLSRLQLEGDLRRLFLQVCEISARALDVTRVSVWLLDDDKQQLRCDALWAVADASPPLPLSLAAVPRYVGAVKQQRFLAIDDARREPLLEELRDYLDVWQVGALLDAAVYRNGQVIGVVCHEHVGAPRAWRREETQFAATVADLTSHFIEVNDRLAAQQHAHQLELKLKDAHRLDALGRMAAGVAHDLNNMLAVISGGITVLQQGYDRELLSTMDTAARHAAGLVSQLMQLGRKQTPAAQLVEVERVVRPLEPVLKAQAPAGVQLVFDLEKDLVVWADANQLVQVLQNLVTNALQAMKAAGVVVLRAHEREGRALFEIIDTGEGIAPEHLDRLFDPFFTTRPSGHGIGLALVQQLVLQHGGDIKVTSTLGDGTTFRVWWPITPP